MLKTQKRTIKRPLIKLKSDMKLLVSPIRARLLCKFFKTAKGEYGEGDKFLGLTVPHVRIISKKYCNLFSLKDAVDLLHSDFHEERLCALFILVLKYEKGDSSQKSKIFDLYLENIKYINNWDLVDLSAYKIIGDYTYNGSRRILFELANSDSLWKKRISLLSTFYFIRKCDFDDSFKLIEILKKDKHDLIHKACGWMLREIGKRDLSREKEYLNKNALELSRTTLRYAIEKFPNSEREKYLLMKKIK